MKEPGAVPSFDESKESQNRKRVKKCFEELELFVLVRHAGYRKNYQVQLWWLSLLLLVFNYGDKEKSPRIKKW